MMDAVTSYEDWFREITTFTPRSWQSELAMHERCEHRMIRVPTGLGKTAGTALAWLYHRVVRCDPSWPRRLVFVLPMRVLVEQVERSLHEWIRRAVERTGIESVDVHVLMGGVRSEPWVLYPEKPAVLVGTQDMLLSRALNRGFGAARGRWPQDFALLNHDVLWVLDEVQLMDAGLLTSVQLAVFRDQDAATRLRFRPARCWWMSATLQPRWFASEDSADMASSLAQTLLHVPESQRTGDPWGVRKPAARRTDVTSPEQIAQLVTAHHTPGTMTLVITNRVDTAVEVHRQIEAHYSQGKGKNRKMPDDAPELRLIHSRFRGMERERWANEFLRRDAAMPPSGRVVVSTQVVEAGVDISARLLVTELAPWPSLVQRAGRAGRVAADDGANVIVVGQVPEQDKDALPYGARELAAADRAWKLLVEREGHAGLAALTQLDEMLEREDPALVQQLYPYAPPQVLKRVDLDELFDTTPDLSGADIDVSGFIRTGEERDVSVAWRVLEKEPKKSLARDVVGKVERRELCPVPVQDARKWLKDVPAAYTWSYLQGRWVSVDRNRLAAGTIVLVPASAGGYDPERGWTPKHKGDVEPWMPASETAPEQESMIEARFDDTAAAQDDDSASRAVHYKTIATHGREAGEVVAELCREIELDEPYRALLELAGRWHDAGKAHPVFQAAIRDDARASGPAWATRQDLAKAPGNAWNVPPYRDRPGFRHELVSTLSLFELLRRTNPDHPALLGACRLLLEATGAAPEEIAQDERISTGHPLAAELAELDERAFNLLAYLVCAHHGKVRCTWTSTPLDQERGDGAIHGVRTGDELPALQLCDRQGSAHELPALALDLSPAALGLGKRYGPSWTERIDALRAELGPFALAYLEALLRAADARASQLGEEDPLP